MGKRIIRVAIIFIISVLLGVSSVILFMKIYMASSDARITNNHWETNTLVGSKEAGMYTRAIVALYGTLALNSSEVIYFWATKDSEGKTLNNDCTYKITGKGDLSTRWWNITIYRGNYWIPNPLKRYSFSKTNIAYEKDGSWVIRVSNEKQKGNWLPVDSSEGPLRITLRLYNPEPTVIDNIRTIELPKIIREECR